MLQAQLAPYHSQNLGLTTENSHFKNYQPCGVWSQPGVPTEGPVCLGHLIYFREVNFV